MTSADHPRPGASARPPALREVFGSLERLGVEWCVLHGYGDLPDRIESDVDLMVAGGARSVAAALAADLWKDGIRLVGRFETPGQNQYCVFATRAAGDWEYLHIDLHERWGPGGTALLEAADVISRRRRHGGMWVACPPDELTYTLSKRLLRGSVTPAHLERWSELLREDPQGSGGSLSRIFGTGSETATKAILHGDETTLIAQRRHLRTRFAPRAPGAAVGRWVRHFSEPNGIIVSLVGSDPEFRTEALRRMHASLVRYPGHREAEGKGHRLVRCADGIGDHSDRSARSSPSAAWKAVARHWLVHVPLRLRSRILLLDGGRARTPAGVGSQAGQGGGAPVGPSTRRMAAWDLLIELAHTEAGRESVSGPAGGSVLRVSASTPGEAARLATGGVLQRLALRHMERLGLRVPAAEWADGSSNSGGAEASG